MSLDVVPYILIKFTYILHCFAYNNMFKTFWKYNLQMAKSISYVANICLARNSKISSELLYDIISGSYHMDLNERNLENVTYMTCVSSE